MYLSKLTPRLPVRDLHRAIRFYTKILNFRCGRPWPEEDPTFAILMRDDVEVQFYVPDNKRPEPAGHATLSFDVDDAAGWHRRLFEHGVQAEWGPEVYWYGRREFGVRDPDGYLLIFSEPTDDPPNCEEGG